MTAWNMFSEEVVQMRFRLSERWSSLGKFAGCPTAHIDSYKQQALVELARRLETDRRLDEANTDLIKHLDLVDAIRGGAPLAEIQKMVAPKPEASRAG